MPIGEPMRQKGSIRTAAFSPDGTRLVTGSYDKTARIWDVRTMKPLGSTLAHRAYVWSVGFSPDGERILTGSFDGTAQIWDGHTGRPRGEPMKHSDMIYGSHLQQRCVDGAHVRPFSQGVALGRRHLASARGAVPTRPRNLDAAFLPGRPVVATASRDGTARLWSVPSRLPELLIACRGNDGPDRHGAGQRRRRPAARRRGLETKVAMPLSDEYQHRAVSEFRHERSQAYRLNKSLRTVKLLCYS